MTVEGAYEDCVRYADKDQHVNYTILLGNNAVADAYGGIRLLPQTFLINRDGTIIKRTSGLQQKVAFENDIKQALKEMPSRPVSMSQHTDCGAGSRSFSTGVSVGASQFAVVNANPWAASRRSSSFN